MNCYDHCEMKTEPFRPLEDSPNEMKQMIPLDHSFESCTMEDA
jgi:hypothetical protein